MLSLTERLLWLSPSLFLCILLLNFFFLIFLEPLEITCLSFFLFPLLFGLGNYRTIWELFCCDWAASWVLFIYMRHFMRGSFSYWRLISKNICIREGVTYLRLVWCKACMDCRNRQEPGFFSNTSWCCLIKHLSCSIPVFTYQVANLIFTCPGQAAALAVFNF